MSGAYAPAEQAAYAAMQARLVALLLRHDERRYGDLYGERGQRAADADAALEPYRELGVLFALRDELFEDILPRITRQLSFAAPRDTSVEQAPASGQVNWARTLDASMASAPGEPPLLLHTRQRRRDFATPENLLAVATLIEYRADAERLLWGERASVGAEALRHPLNEIAALCERAMAFPQFAGIREQARQAVDAGALPELEDQVASRLIPGGSAYEALLAWREKKRGLRLLRRDAEAQPMATLGADPERDNQLYELWIYYELADMLRTHGLLEAWDQQAALLRFRWGDVAYYIQYNHAISGQPQVWRGGPGVRPDFYMARAEGRRELRDAAGTLVWREPGYMLDAKYHRPPEDADAAGRRAPTGPIKRMIADLHLTGERHGALLFAFYGGPQAQVAQAVQPLPTAQRSAPDTSIRLVNLSPGLDQQALATSLRGLLDMVHAALSTPMPEVRCHGIFLDALSASEQATLADRYGQQIEGDRSELLLCPKPHVGPWRIDLVSRQRHCCADPQLCHILGQANSHPPTRPPRTAEDLLRELQQIFSRARAGELGEEEVSAIARQVEAITKRFAELAGAYQQLHVYYHRLRDLGLETLEHFAPAEKESLALAIFLLEKLDSIGANDYSAPAIHISSVIEIEIKRRVFACPDLTGDIAKPQRQTLGTLPFMRNNPHLTEGNWERVLAFAAAHWREQLRPDDPELTVRFDDLITKGINRIAQIRNHAAHTQPLSRQEYSELQQLAFQGRRLPSGVLNILWQAWH